MYKNKEGNLVERRGRRHHVIIRAIHDAGDIALYKKWHVDGFIYGEEWTAQFIDREEATKIAMDEVFKHKDFIEKLATKVAENLFVTGDEARKMWVEHLKELEEKNNN